MTASILKQDPNTAKVQKNAIYWDKTQAVDFGNNPLYNSTQLNQKQTSALALHLIFHRFSLFNCCLSVVLQFDKGNYPENLHVVFCPNKQRSFESFMCLDLINQSALTREKEGHAEWNHADTKLFDMLCCRHSCCLCLLCAASDGGTIFRQHHILDYGS